MSFWSYSSVDANLGGGLQGTEGKLWRFRPDATLITDFYEVLPPVGMVGIKARHSTAVYNDHCYQVGSWSDNALIDKQYRLLRQGIKPWAGTPTVAAAAGPGVTGSCRVAHAFYDEITSERSPLSGFSAPLALANQKRAHSNIPTVGPEDEFQAAGTSTANAVTTIVGVGSRFTTELRIGDQISLSSAPGTYGTVLAIASDTSLTSSVALGNGTSQRINVRRVPRWSHVEIWIEMDDALPRLAVRVQIGTTSITEGVATLALGEAYVTAFTRMPRSTISAFYRERQWVGDYTDTITASGLFFPERSEGLVVKTKNGEPVIALLNFNNDVLLAMTPFNMYAIRGYTAADVIIELVDAENGALNHWLNLMIFGRAFIPHKNGVNVFNGAPHSISNDIDTVFTREYRTHETQYEDGFAIQDANWKTFEAVVSGAVSMPELHDPEDAVPQTVGWVCQYDNMLPETGGGFSQPDWMFDAMQRTVRAGALLFKPGARRGDVYFGFNDGFIRRRDETGTDISDNGDTLGKLAAIRSRAEGLNDPSGDAQEGKEFTRFTTFMETEEDVTNVYFIGGPSTSWQATLPDNTNQFWTQVVGPTQLIGQVNPDTGVIYDYVPEDTHNHVPSKVSGRTVTGIWSVTTPADSWRWRGWGGMWGPGPKTRPYSSRVNPS